MKPKAILAYACLLGAACTGAYFLGVKSTDKEKTALTTELQKLRNLTEEQQRLIEGESGIDWDRMQTLDPITRKHMIISLWYTDQAHGTYWVGREMGHTWGPVWNRRSPLSILDEQTRVMEKFLADLRKLETESGHPPKGPTQDHRDPTDGSKIDWEDFIRSEDPGNSTLIWIGKSIGTGKWMAYEYGKGVYQPDAELLKKIIAHHKASNDPGPDPFASPENESDQSDTDPFSEPE